MVRVYNVSRVYNEEKSVTSLSVTSKYPGTNREIPEWYTGTNTSKSGHLFIPIRHCDLGQGKGLSVWNNR